MFRLPFRRAVQHISAPYAHGFSGSRGRSMEALLYRAAGVTVAGGMCYFVCGNAEFRSSALLAQSQSNPGVYSWGSNQYGQLGLGDEINQPCPMHVQSLPEGIKHLSAGAQNAAVLTEKGEIYTFGRGQYEALGYGETTNIAFPRQIDMDEKFVFVDASETHGVAIDEVGRLWSWGSRATGRAGDGAFPALVTGALEGKKVVTAACGRGHTLAVTEDGQLYSWGDGREGALGLGDKRDEDTPKLVTALAGKKVLQVSAGDGCSIACTEDGTVFTFGSSDFGQSGQGNLSERYLRTPTAIRSLGNKRVSAVAMGDYHAACVTDKGEVYVWGLGSDGQIGVGNKNLHNPMPSKVTALAGKKVVGVSCGGGHTAAVDSEGNLYIWGRGRDGQLGRADHIESVAAYRDKPVTVEYFPDHNLKVKQVSLGKDFSMVITTKK
eukprot:g61948.t1